MTQFNGGDSRVPANGTDVGDSNNGLRERRPSSANRERSKVSIVIHLRTLINVPKLPID